MKKITALFLSVFLFMMAVSIPIRSYAQNDKELEEIIKIARAKLDIPDTFEEFNYNMSNEGERKIWYLNWSSKDDNKGNVNVSITDKGTILNYYYYKPYSNPESKFPKISKQEAKSIAEGFIKRINPEYADQLKFVDNHETPLMDIPYRIEYIRTVNNIPFYENTVEIQINPQTGEVQSYYCNWTEDVEFPKPENIISPEDAQKAYKEKLGLHLIYKYTYEGKKLNTYLVYTPVHSGNYYIDAFTGEKIDLASDGFIPLGGRGIAEKQMMSTAADYTANEVVLSPEEMNAVKEAGNLLSQEKAEKTARDFKYLELTNEYKLTGANLFGYMNNESYAWHLYFNNRDAKKDKTDKYRNVTVTVNAKTGEIQNFYVDTPYEENAKVKFDKDSARTEVEKFLKEFKPNTFHQTVYDENYQPVYRITAEDEKPEYFNFYYIRKVNDIPFPSNGFTVGFNAVTGKITSFDMNWFDAEFASAANVMEPEKIYEIMFSDIGIELQYRSSYANNYKVMPVPPTTVKPEIKLVYSEKPGKPVILDANSGIILDYSGKPFKEKKAVQYTDIEGHFAENYINTLAELGISFEEPEFRPDENITQLDFFVLLAKTLNQYQIYPMDNRDKLIEQVYSYLMREGIVKENEKSPDSFITREDAMKFIIRALKYDKVANIKGIFNCSFKDVEQINPDLIGYVTIAAGLGIVNANSEYFYPKNHLTRAQAAVIIYNYLQ